jgi:hypothetical protein
VRILDRRNFLYVLAAVCLISVGYGLAILQLKRTDVLDRAMTATAELLYSYELLQTLQNGDTKTALNGIAIKADHLVSEIAEVEDRRLNEDQREFRKRVLTKYKSFRDTHPALYVVPSQIDARTRADMVRTQQEIGEFLKKATK